MKKSIAKKFNYLKLKGKITEKNMTLTEVAEKLELTIQSFSKRLNGELDFKSSEIFELMKMLEIPKKDINLYFFEEEVK